MNKKVEDCIKQLEQRAGYTEVEHVTFVNGKITKEAKDKLAFSLGLTEKVFSPSNTKSSEYPEVMYDQETKQVSYYKNQLLEISDEEYIRIFELTEVIKGQKKCKSLLGFLTFFIVLVSICGVISAILYLSLIVLLAALVQVVILYSIRIAVKTAFECKSRLDGIEARNKNNLSVK